MKKRVINKQLEEIKSFLKKRADRELIFKKACVQLGINRSYLYMLVKQTSISFANTNGKIVFLSKGELEELIIRKAKVQSQKS